MRGHLIGTSATTLVLSFVAASCRFPSSQSPSCDDDKELCPKSSRSATSVTCDCRCTLGVSEDTGQNFDGHIAVCLPAELNRATARDDQQLKLESLEPRVFDQRVFQYCSKDVARFLRSAIRVPARLVLACAVPITCTCTTKGTQADTNLCHSECNDVACDAKNCPSVLRKDEKVDLQSCFCSRAETCGVVTPAVDAPALCRDWTRPATVPNPN
jgi:hypothetical protein